MKPWDETYREVEAIQVKILSWVKRMKADKKDTAELMAIYEMLEHTKILQYNIEKRLSEQIRLRNRIELRKDQLRFLYENDEPLNIIGIPKEIVTLMRSNNLTEIKNI